MEAQTPTRMPIMREEDMLSSSYSRGKCRDSLAREVQLWRNNNGKTTEVMLVGEGDLNLLQPASTLLTAGDKNPREVVKEQSGER
jgi:hypothetical protein